MRLGWSAVIALALSSIASAQPLWQDISSGDTPEFVAQKLASNPEIKSAKVKIRSGKQVISISYRGSGIHILDQDYVISTDFGEDGLRKFSLNTDLVCANRAYQQYAKMELALSGKYPKPLVGTRDIREYDVSRAQSEATQQNPTSLASIFTDGKVVVIYRQQYVRESAPSYVYTGNSSLNALQTLMINQYRVRGAECDGTGHDRMASSLIYMSIDQFNTEAKAIESDHNAELQKARNSL